MRRPEGNRFNWKNEDPHGKYWKGLGPPKPAGVEAPSLSSPLAGPVSSQQEAGGGRSAEVTKLALPNRTRRPER